MLRQVFITLDGESIYNREFGKALDEEAFEQVLKHISKEASNLTTESIQYHDYFKYRITYLSVPNKNTIFFFVSDLSDKFNSVKKELQKCRKEFMDMFGEILDEKLDEDTFEVFDPTIELIHKNLRPKISLIGFSGVGKTTITRLITAEDIPIEHIPTITGDIGTIKIGKLHFHLWDFAGQEQFSFLWNNFIKGSDAVLLITDSTLENCEKSKYFIELVKKEAPMAHTAVIGNKQDLPDAMPIIDIERHLSMKCYSMIATDPGNRDKMITILGDILEMSGEISPLLKPLIDRDKKMLEAEEALENGNFELAMSIFEELADLSLDLGDDRVSQDFHEKAQKIRNILKKSQPAVSQPVVQAPPMPSAQSPPMPPVEQPPMPPVQQPTKPPVQQPPKPPVQQPPMPPVQQPTKPPVQQPSMPPGPQPSTPPVQKPPAPPNQELDQLGLMLKKLQTKTNKSNSPASQTSVGVSKSILPSKTPKVETHALSNPKVSEKPILEKTQATSSESPISAENVRTDLKIKIANVNKNLLDLEMQNITGEITDEIFDEKTKRLNSVKVRLENQLDELKEIK
ncbi:ADP-ribosylation factor-like protein [Promethearchaeum syntrophicum]|uniref:ADP-ribosylation factor-like protein n=1 Tax=Promethearchaeum syntrophicum TaxID=2594042 RepID=A0A5B9DER0_9ARCH|nr:ADP-ribosylation factor-like protein [Candidatus Prometheoarchaeum syntrophicum]QEE17260.1 ADP-ribosylation factor family protein [Candidatus Prometheoarchaeum syntrophicum]